MTTQAEALGFTYSHKGCPCNGLNHVYKKNVGNSVQQLTIWPTRNTWQLKSRGVVLARGNKDNMTFKIKELWDL